MDTWMKEQAKETIPVENMEKNERDGMKEG